MWYNTTLRNDYVTKELVKPRANTLASDKKRGERKRLLFVVSDRKLEMARYDTLLLVITSGVTSEFKNFGGEVFKDSCEVN